MPTANNSTLKVAAEKHTQLAKVEITAGKKSARVIELFDKKFNRVEFAPSVIIFKDKKYELKFPLLCTIDIVSDEVKIENPTLGLYAAGTTLEEAEQIFNEEFDYLYTRYNELPDSKLTYDVKIIKSFLNYIVKS